jgi:hypothetical protein
VHHHPRAGKKAMTTRESTRQELRDLARLASSMPKERPTPTPPPAELQRPSTPSSISVNVPPAVASIPPPSVIAGGSGSKKRSGTPFVVLAVSLGIAVAIAGGAEVGRYLAHKGPVSAAASAPITVSTATTDLPAAAVATPSPAAPASPAAGPADPAPVAAASPAPVVAATTPSTQVPKAAPVLLRRGQQPRPAAKPSLAVTIPTSGGAPPKDSLEDAIRKAVAATPQK